MTTFTQDWFSHTIPPIPRSIEALRRPPRRILEIGSYEGRSTCWFLDTYPQATVTCVDTFEGSIEHAGTDMRGVEERFVHNVSKYGDRVVVLKGRSDRVLFTQSPESFDVVYVDGSHEAPDVLSDIVLAFHLVVPNGVVLIDDYASFPGVKRAVDAFVEVYREKIEVLHVGYQVHVCKK